MLALLRGWIASYAGTGKTDSATVFAAVVVSKVS
jgi:hypothetical protein